MLGVEYVRVEDKSTGHKLTLVRSAAEADQDAYKILKDPAVDHNGMPLPPEFPASTTSGPKADNTKEN